MLNATIDVMLELSPWLLLGMLVAGVLHVTLPTDFIRNRLSGRFGVLRAVGLGVPLPLCSCGVIPAGLGLRRDGASRGASMGFLISTPQTGIDSMLVSASFLGWPFALYKVLAAAVTGLVGGWITDAVTRDEVASAELDAGKEAEVVQPRSWRGMLDHTLDILGSIWRWLVIGVLVSAAIEVFVPAGTFEGLAKIGPIGACLAVLAISLPLYVCATASVPIAAALVANGMPTGAALVFLMAGPATNVATIGAIYRNLGARSLLVYLGTIVIGSIGFGALFDLGVDPAQAQAHVEHHSPGVLAIASAVLLSALILRFAVRDARRWLADRLAVAEPETIEIPIGGMSCQNCVSKLEGALGAVDGVESVHVSRNPDRARLRGSATRSTLEAAIIEAGYQVA